MKVLSPVPPEMKIQKNILTNRSPFLAFVSTVQQFDTQLRQYIQSTYVQTRSVIEKQSLRPLSLTSIQFTGLNYAKSPLDTSNYWDVATLISRTRQATTQDTLRVSFAIAWCKTQSIRAL